MNAHDQPEIPVHVPKHATNAAPLDVRHLLIDDARGPSLGANGVATVALQLAREQNHAGHSARILIMRQEHRRAEGAMDVPIDTRVLNGASFLGRRVGLSRDDREWMLADLSSRTVFHVHSGRDPLLLAIVRCFVKQGVPFAITPHGRYSHVDGTGGTFARKVRRRAAFAYLRFVESACLRRARLVHAVTSSEARLLRRIAPRATVHCLPNAAYSSAMRPAASLRLSGPSEGHPVRFGYCGRFAVEHKGLDLMIEGFALYRRRGGRGALSLVGEGQVERLREIVSAVGLDDVIALHGPKFEQEKMNYLRTLDFFVHSSRYDGLPTGCLEAALEGLPLVVSRGSNLREKIIEWKAGVGLRSDTVDGVADALAEAEATSLAEWEKMSRNAVTMSRSLGDWTVISASLLDFLLPKGCPADVDAKLPSPSMRATN